ncbi:hypothetical protein Mgra_00001788 [Meloidogyne graminicola]|uniref:Small ribosomal subunit protein uS15m n=1 Tax=Meloidogyne graminicola TaxID=189291 RepID=A0A8T0A093_9BILA|nr:hypothetical protein Mgra_00001788 [Meloidogyne graminicola]
MSFNLIPQKYYYLCFRQLHLSNILGYGRFTYFNIHKNVTDPARQDPDYFEKEAKKLPLEESKKKNNNKRVEDLPLKFCDYIMLMFILTWLVWPIMSFIQNKSYTANEESFYSNNNNYIKQNNNKKNERPTFNYFLKKSSEKKFGGTEVISILFIVISWSIFLFPVQIKVLFWEALESFYYYLCFRQLHLSNILGYGRFTYFNIHKNVTDPARQDPDYFEKEAEKLPLDARYIDQLKIFGKEKIGSERQLIFKAQDNLIGNSTDYGLPRLNMDEPKLDYRGIDALESAPESVKKIFSLAHASSRDMNMAWKSEMIKKVRRDDLDGKSLSAKIGWATATIRNWNRVYAEFEVQRNTSTRNPKLPRATWISHPLYLLINQRRKWLRLLREQSEEDFQRCINELRISYIVQKEPEHVKTRKVWSEVQLKRRIAIEKEKQLDELHNRLKDNREEKMHAIDKEAKALANELRKEKERLHQLDIIEKKTVSNIVGEYEPNYIGEMTEIVDNAQLFVH